jgi:hypothetical protein
VQEDVSLAFLLQDASSCAARPAAAASGDTCQMVTVFQCGRTRSTHLSQDVGQVTRGVCAGDAEGHGAQRRGDDVDHGGDGEKRAGDCNGVGHAQGGVCGAIAVAVADVTQQKTDLRQRSDLEQKIGLKMWADVYSKAAACIGGNLRRKWVRRGGVGGVEGGLYWSESE